MGSSHYRYKDSTKTSFKSSTRLECMMQDYPKTLPPSAKVGFTVSWHYILGTVLLIEKFLILSLCFHLLLVSCLHM